MTWDFPRYFEYQVNVGPSLQPGRIMAAFQVYSQDLLVILDAQLKEFNILQIVYKDILFIVNMVFLYWLYKHFCAFYET